MKEIIIALFVGISILALGFMLRVLWEHRHDPSDEGEI